MKLPIYLASDRLKGRHIGGAGINIAANYIVAQLKKAGALLVPGAAGYFKVFTKTISRFDFKRVAQDLEYNVPGFEPAKNFTLKNIVAYILGTDPILSRQYIMLSAHYDHIGIADTPLEVDGKLDSIFNVARDNATGVAAVIAAAPAQIR